MRHNANGNGRAEISPVFLRPQGRTQKIFLRNKDMNVFPEFPEHRLKAPKRQAELRVYRRLADTNSEQLEVFNQRYQQSSILVTTNLPFDEWTGVFRSERLTGGLPDRLTHLVHVMEMNGQSYRLRHCRENSASKASDNPDKV